MSANRWTPVDAKLGECIERSDSTQPIPRELWPSNAENMAIRRQSVIGVYGFSCPPPTTSSNHSRVVGGYDLFRRGKEVPFKADRWLLAKTSSGSYYQQGPIKDVPHGHHSAALPPWAKPEQERS